MKQHQAILLGISVMAGVIWIFLFQNILFLNVFPGVFMGSGLRLDDYLQTGSSPSFAVLWVSCLSALLIWLSTTSRSSCRNSSEVRRMRPKWWMAASVLVVLGWLYQLFFTVFIWQIRGESPVEGSGVSYFPLPAAGWSLIMLVVVLDVVLLFWLPTLLASPKSFRFVVPGAVKILGGR